jgi:hypothetical protein
VRAPRGPASRAPAGRSLPTGAPPAGGFASSASAAGVRDPTRARRCAESLLGRRSAAGTARSGLCLCRLRRIRWPFTVASAIAQRGQRDGVSVSPRGLPVLARPPETDPLACGPDPDRAFRSSKCPGHRSSATGGETPQLIDFTGRPGAPIVELSLGGCLQIFEQAQASPRLGRIAPVSRTGGTFVGSRLRSRIVAPASYGALMPGWPIRVYVSGAGHADHKTSLA